MVSPMDSQCIQLEDYIIIQRQKYTKLQKFSNLDTLVMLGNEQLELRSLLNQPYGSTFKMCVKETIKGNNAHRGRKRHHTLELCTETELRSIREVLGISESGTDNRDISDNKESQALKTEDIEQLREACTDSTKLIEKIVENSKTFHSKTEYSQEKYLKKKEKKYFEYVQIHRPTIRLMTEIYSRHDSEKVLGIRLDTLSQIISYSGVSGFGNYLLYDSGTNGLLPAAMLNSIGADTDGTLVHMHPGSVPQKQAILALKLPKEQLDRCIFVNIYSVLREYYQGNNDDQSEQEQLIEKPDAAEPISKKPKLEIENEDEDGDVNENENAPVASKGTNTITAKWKLENKQACELMHARFDSLVIAAKEHPSSILNSLLSLVKPSRPIVIFSLCKELLMDMYIDLKRNSQITNLHLTSNWMRMYQIMPNRTHPEVNMNGNSGYLLTGYTLS